MKKLLCILVISLCALTTVAQRASQKWFRNGIGLRAEVTSTNAYLGGLDYETYIKPEFGLNVMALTDFCMIYEGALVAKYNLPFPNIDSHLRWYTGGGIYGGYESKNKEVETSIDKYYFGPLLCLGTGYSFEKVPINICIEWRPSIKAYYKNYVLQPNRERLNAKSVMITVRFYTKDQVKDKIKE